MKKLLAIALSVLILSSSFKDLVAIAGFYMNQSFIEKFLCVNRNNENSECHGKCYLNKTLRQAEEKEKRNPVEKKELSSLSVFLDFPEILTDFFTSKEMYSRITFQDSFYTSNFQYEIFHPPQLS